MRILNYGGPKQQNVLRFHGRAWVTSLFVPAISIGTSPPLTLWILVQSDLSEAAN